VLGIPTTKFEYLENDKSTNVGNKCTNQQKRSTNEWPNLILEIPNWGANEMELTCLRVTSVRNGTCFWNSRIWWRPSLSIFLSFHVVVWSYCTGTAACTTHIYINIMDDSPRARERNNNNRIRGNKTRWRGGERSGRKNNRGQRFNAVPEHYIVTNITYAAMQTRTNQTPYGVSTCTCLRVHRVPTDHSVLFHTESRPCFYYRPV
jgi:hypothetical protein